MIQRFSGLLSLVFIAHSMTGCANSQFLKGMTLSTSVVNSQTYLNLTTDVNMGNIALAQADIPIQDPNSGANLGDISFSTAASGQQTITLSVNSSSVLNGTAALGSTLPNGRALPSAVGGVSGNIVGIPVLNQSRVYVGGDMTSGMVLGFAFVIPAMDSMGVIGNANIFFGNAFNANLSGVAGVFSGSTANESGIAVFAHYTPTAATTTTVTANVVKAKAVSMSLSSSSSSTSANVNVSGSLGANQYNVQYNDGMSTSGQQKVYNYFYGKKRVVSPQ